MHLNVGATSHKIEEEEEEEEEVVHQKPSEATMGKIFFSLPPVYWLLN